MYYRQLHLKYLCNLARYCLQSPWGWHDSVETCRGVKICEIIVHLLVIVQNKKDTRYMYQNLKIILYTNSRGQLKCDGTSSKTWFLLSAKRMSPFKSAGASVQSTTGSRGLRISGSNAGYTMFRGSVKSTGYPLHSPVSPSLLLPCVTLSHHTSTGVYHLIFNYHYTCLSKIWRQSHIWNLTEPTFLYAIVYRLRMTYYRPKHVAEHWRF